MRAGRIRVTWGFPLLLSLLFLVDRAGLFYWLCLAVLVHESGHLLMIWLLGGRIGSLVCGGFGLSLYASRLSYGREILAALMGPVFSLAFAAAAAYGARDYPSLYPFAGLNLTLGLFNLLPAPALDGGRMIYLCFLWRGQYEAAQKAALAGTFFCALLLAYWALFYNAAFWVGMLGVIFTAFQEKKQCLQK